MLRDTNQAVMEWLYANAGPIIQWRLVRDFAYPSSKKEADRLLQAVVSSEEVQRWLSNLGGGIHGSKDTHAENAIAKLVEYGIEKGLPEFDEKMMPYADRVGTYRPTWLSDQLAPFLIAGGYAAHKRVRECFLKRLDLLYSFVKEHDSIEYLSSQETEDIPKAWQGKPVYRFDYDAEGSVPLPSCYDLYALAHWPHDSQTTKKAEAVMSFVSQPTFQNTEGGFFWDRKRHVCHSAGRGWLACCEPKRIVLFVGLAARFASARDSEWFKAALANLESCQTKEGRYSFPKDYLKEKRNSYYMYQGNHMGLGESRRKKQWIEVESTFQMLNIRRLMNMETVPTKLPAR